MADDDLVYLLRRAAEEKVRAAESIHDRARLAHQGLAQAYEAKLRGEAREPLSVHSGVQAGKPGPSDA